MAMENPLQMKVLKGQSPINGVFSIAMITGGSWNLSFSGTFCGLRDQKDWKNGIRPEENETGNPQFPREGFKIFQNPWAE